MHRFLVIVLLGLTTPAVAQQTPAAPPAAPNPKSEEAKQLYEAGKRAYNIADFDTAIDDWKQGYKLSGESYFLFNVAQAYRMKKDPTQAIFFYKAYLRENPNADNRDAVNDKISEMEKLQSTQPPEPPPPDHNQPPPPDNHNTPPPPPPDNHEGHQIEPPRVVDTDAHPGRTLKIIGAVAGGVGVLFAIGGIASASGAASIQSDLEKQAASHAVYDQNARDEESRGRSKATMADIFVAGSVILVGTGVALFVVGAGAHPGHVAAEHALVVPTVSPHGAGVVAEVTF
jgi:hypothetical protein